MEQIQLSNSPADQSLPAPIVAPNGGEIVPSQQVGNGSPSASGGGTPSLPSAPVYVYAIGKVEARFPRLSVEKEFAQATGRSATNGLTDRQALSTVLNQNRYLARQLCYVLTIEGLDTYILAPRDPADLTLMIEAAGRDTTSPMDMDVVIGVLGPIAPPTICNGLQVPIVVFDQLYSFDRDSLIAAIPRPPEASEEQFKASAGELLARILQVSDNAGATDEARALNYLAVRYPAIYTRTAEGFRANESLTAVDVRSSRLSGTRNIVEVVFSFTNRNTDVVDKYFVRVDVTEEFPFLVTKLSPYFDH